jgi:4-methoxybenzoate monooxygenase (O-demethylating)
LSHWRQFSSARGVGTTDFAKEKPWWGERAVLIESDPPRHNEIRSHVMKVLKPSAVSDLGPEFRVQADLLLDRVLAQSSFDAQKEIAVAYPLKVFGDALGIDSENRENLLIFGDLVFNSFGPQNSVRRKAQEQADAVDAVNWMRSRTSREAVQEGSLGYLLHQLSDNKDLTPQESANVMRGQLSAGVDTTVAALGYMFYAFAKYPRTICHPIPASFLLRAVWRY